MSDPRQWNFDIDRYVNRLVPPPPWPHLPYPVARFFGYRRPDDKRRESGNLVPIFWAFIGIFCSLSLIEGVSMHIPEFNARGAPMIVGSFGAAAVLEFYAIESPLSQPRNALFGQLIACLVGCSVSRLFLLSDDFTNLQWLGGAISCAATTSLMALTRTVHPPAGATAILAVTDDRLVKLGWFLFPVVMLGIALMMVVALLVNNIGKRFPMYWWTPEDLRPGKKEPMFERRRSSDMKSEEGEREGHDVEADASSGQQALQMVLDAARCDEIIIRRGHVTVPEHMYLRQEEKWWLESLSQRL